MAARFGAQRRRYRRLWTRQGNREKPRARKTLSERQAALLFSKTVSRMLAVRGRAQRAPSGARVLAQLSTGAAVIRRHGLQRSERRLPGPGELVINHTALRAYASGLAGGQI